MRISALEKSTQSVMILFPSFLYRHKDNCCVEISGYCYEHLKRQLLLLDICAIEVYFYILIPFGGCFS